MRVANRHIIYVQGYDQRGLAQYYRMFRTELRKYARLYGLSTTIRRPRNISGDEIASWSIETKADDWQTRTTYDFLRFEDFIQRDIAVPIPRIVAHMMAELNWTPSSIREFLWEHSCIPVEHLRRAGAPSWFELDPNPRTRESIRMDPWPITAKPDNITLIVAGGSHPTNTYWLQSFCPRVMGRVVRTPESFDRLLAAADRDLGCGSEECRI